MLPSTAIFGMVYSFEYLRLLLIFWVLAVVVQARIRIREHGYESLIHLLEAFFF